MSGDRDAQFRAWAMARRDALRRTAYLMCGDWALADDLVQDALTRLYEVWPRVSGRGDPSGYARRVLLNLFIDHGRRPARREQPTDQVPDAAVPETSGSDDRDQLLAALRKVPTGQRTVLVLRFWEDQSVEQAAALLGTSPSTVRSQTSRGLVALRQALADEGLPDAFSFQEQEQP